NRQRNYSIQRGARLCSAPRASPCGALRPGARIPRAVLLQIADVVVETMGDVFPEVRAKQKTIKETIRREEEAFNKTLDKGIELFNDQIRALTRIPLPLLDTPSGRQVSGEFAFKLYDTYGFPLDLTELM